MIPIVFYHDDCIDGYAAAMAAYEYFDGEVQLMPFSYGQPLPRDLIHDRGVYVLDFSFPEKDMDYLFQHSRSTVWLDHHKTAFEMWLGEGRDYTVPYSGQMKEHHIVLDNGRSGAMIAWEWFMGAVPLIISHIDDYDRWQFKLPNTKAVIKALWSRQWTPSFWKVLSTLREHSEFYSILIAEGEAILQSHMRNCESLAENAIPFTLQANGFWAGAIINCPHHMSSDVGHLLAKKYGLGLLWYVDSQGKVRCGLRGNGTIDVSKLAKCFGGGGHFSAAGFEGSFPLILEWMQSVVK